MDDFKQLEQRVTPESKYNKFNKTQTTFEKHNNLINKDEDAISSLSFKLSKKSLNNESEKKLPYKKQFKN
jgi:hypothetical protein